MVLWYCNVLYCNAEMMKLKAKNILPANKVPYKEQEAKLSYLPLKYLAKGKSWPHRRRRWKLKDCYTLWVSNLSLQRFMTTLATPVIPFINILQP